MIRYIARFDHSDHLLVVWGSPSPSPVVRLLSSSCSFYTSNMDIISVDRCLDEAEQQVARRAQEIEDRLLARNQERDTIIQAYSDAWKKFYNWEAEFCRSLLEGLQCVPSAQDGDDTATPLYGSVEVDAMSVDGSLFDVFDVETGLVTTLDVGEVNANTIFVPHPKYEACTPAIQNIATDDYPNWLAFISYADEPGFDPDRFAHQYKHWLWRDCIRDPDGIFFILFKNELHDNIGHPVSLIALEALYTLEALPMAHDTINAHAVLPNLFSHHQQKGLILRSYNRLAFNAPSHSGLLGRATFVALHGK